MEFFNFRTEETYHFFRWLTRGGRHDPAALVADAYRRLGEERDAADERDEYLKLGEDALGVCFAVRSVLARRLGELLGEGLPAGTPWCVGEQRDCAVDRGHSSLWQPLLALAAFRVDYIAVAEALLVRAGKWAPEVGPLDLE
jgi:hypothetical protein